MRAEKPNKSLKSADCPSGSRFALRYDTLIAFKIRVNGKTYVRTD